MDVQGSRAAAELADAPTVPIAQLAGQARLRVDDGGVGLPAGGLDTVVEVTRDTVDEAVQYPR